MRLQICEALVGTPVEGDSVEVVLSGGRVLHLVHKPHPTWDNFTWAISEEGKWPKELELMSISRRVRSRKSFTAYVDRGSIVAVNCELNLALVPSGNHTLWPKAVTEQRVLEIELL